MGFSHKNAGTSIRTVCVNCVQNKLLVQLESNKMWNSSFEQGQELDFVGPVYFIIRQKQPELDMSVLISMDIDSSGSKGTVCSIKNHCKY